MPMPAKALETNRLVSPWETVLVTFLACIVTHAAAHWLTGNTVAASALISLLYLGLCRWRGVRGGESGCLGGSFAGMTNPNALLPDSLLSPRSDWGFILVVALLNAGAFRWVMAAAPRYHHRLLAGYGGRLGMIAFLCEMILFVPLLIATAGQHISWGWPYTPIDLGLTSTLACMGALASRRLAVLIRSSPSEATVAAAALLGLLAGAVLWPLSAIDGRMAALAFYAGAITGMSSAAVIPSYRQMALCGALTGLVYPVFAIPFAGTGGLMGFAALLCIVLVRLIGARMVFLHAYSKK